MKIFSTKLQLQQYVQQVHLSGKKVGFVPTMGALHQGHISLIEQARSNNDVVICSIFVNPTQFTDPADLDKYPRPIATDIKKLEQADCDVLFNPAVTEMYAVNEHWHLDIGELEHLLEGEFRPGHYQGVMQVVYKLFDIVNPDMAFFGQKDYQQFLVIKQMIALRHLSVKLVMCPILRDMDGLAMSSRNIHLSATQRQQALILSKTLYWLQGRFDARNITALAAEAELMIKKQDGVDLEYFRIVDANNLRPANQNTPNMVALVAARVGKTRLIDNVILVDS